MDDVYRFVAKEHGLSISEVREMLDTYEKRVQYYLKNPVLSFKSIRLNNIFLFQLKKLNWDNISKQINAKRINGESKKQLIKLMEIFDI